MRTTVKPLAVALVGASLSLGGEVLGNYLSETVGAGTEYFWMVLIAVVVFAALYSYVLYNQKRVEVDITAEAIRTADDAQEHPHRGLIVFVSLYRAFQGPAAKLTSEQIDDAVRRLDYKTLDLANTSSTNLGHQIVAIRTHSQTLQHCWLVTTRAKTEGKKHSLDFAPVLQAFVKKEIRSEIKMHYGERYSIVLDDEAKICRRTYKLVQAIYKEAEAFGISKEQMITDVTGGIRSLSVAATLACLDQDENIQYLGVDYDDNGNPSGLAFPVIVEYRPHIQT